MVLLCFIDEKRLLEALEPVEKTLTRYFASFPSLLLLCLLSLFIILLPLFVSYSYYYYSKERFRNRYDESVLGVRRTHTLAAQLELLYNEQKEARSNNEQKEARIIMDEKLSQGMFGSIIIYDKKVEVGVKYVSNIDGVKDVDNNQASACKFLNPPAPETGTFCLLSLFIIILPPFAGYYYDIIVGILRGLLKGIILPPLVRRDNYQRRGGDNRNQNDGGNNNRLLL